MTQQTLSPFEPSRITVYPNPAYNREVGFDELCRGVFEREGFTRAKGIISQWPGYAPTPLVSLSGLAGAIAVNQVLYKDESHRFGLESFKALGGAYAVYRLLVDTVGADTGEREVGYEDLRAGRYRELTGAITVASATDGNHGRSVAWGAQQFGCNCVIYIHAGVSKGREEALTRLGARVVRVSGNYDESVERCAEDAKDAGWHVVSDTSWETYRDTPREVMNGYAVIAEEIAEQVGDKVPTHVFVQAGVGGLAAAMDGAFLALWGAERPRLVVVEPVLAACLLNSGRQGKRAAVDVQEETMMAGLSCGEVSLLAWQILQRGAAEFVSIPDDMVAPAMRLLASSPYGDSAIVAGESAVAGLAAVIAICRDESMARTLDLSDSSRVLLIGTEGATDPDIYRRIVYIEPAQAISV